MYPETYEYIVLQEVDVGNLQQDVLVYMYIPGVHSRVSSGTCTTVSWVVKPKKRIRW